MSWVSPISGAHVPGAKCMLHSNAVLDGVVASTICQVSLQTKRFGVCRGASMLGEQQNLVADVFRGASFLAQVVCGSAGAAVPGLSAIAKLLQKLDVLMSQAAASDVSQGFLQLLWIICVVVWPGTPTPLYH